MSLRETLKSVFDNDFCGAEEFLSKVIVPIFGEDDVDVFDAVESNPTRADEETLKKANIVEIYRVAQVDRIGTDPIEVFDVTLGDNTNISRSRVGIQRIIRSSLFPYSHAFILFHHKVLNRTEWRFSYVYKEDKNATTTDAKRYTYLFSRDMHARTAIDRFCKLAESSKDNEALLDAFNVEALSDDFFEKYRAQYAKFVKYITGKEYVKERGKYVEKVTGKPNKELYDTFGRDDKAIRDYVKKMMGRITFLHFLQRKRWLRDDVNYMLNLFKESKYKKDYLDKVLEPLFFGILNTKPENRQSFFKSSGWDLDLLDEWKDIPYLNGGLFEQDEVDKCKSVFPAEYFDSLLTFFSEYNFTVDENDPDDAEVGVDPEMLGKIFENLLEDNKDKGAFYTPKEIVRYMCRESLIAYLLEKTGIDEPAIRDFVTSPYEKEEQMEWADKEKILTALEEVKICDPAIGSGAFPMGLLNELVRCEEAIVLGQEKNKGRAELKKAIIKNNIYGVDIEKGAIDIARLRFWLSLVVDEEEPTPLPNLDYKIMQGNSLLESYKGMDLSHLLDGQDGMLNFGEDTRKELKEKLDQYYTCEEHSKKKELQEDINELVHQQIIDSGRVVKGFESIDVSANQDFFLWHTWFSDVFSRGDDDDEQSGFDIVIGNPPYVQIKWLPQKNLYSKAKFDTFDSSGDIYCLFYELGTRILRKNGTGIYITSNKWLKSNYGVKLRNYFIDNTSPTLLIDLGAGVFKTATVDTNILLWQKKYYNEPTDVCTVDNVQLIGSVRHEKIIFALNDIWNINSADVISIKNKIERISTNLSNIDVELEYGILTGANDAFILDEETAKRLIRLDSRNKQLIKPILRGKDLGRYCAEFKHIYLLCVHNGVKKEGIPPINIKKDYPSLVSYFEQFGKKFKNRGEQGATYFNLRNCAYILKYEEPKIIYADIVQDQGKFYYDTDKYYTNDTAFLITGRNLQYLVGILNSKAFTFFYKKFYCGGALGNKGLRFKRDYLMRVPVPIGTREQQRDIVSLVTDIMKEKKKNCLADTTIKEQEIDSIVYKLYDLDENDIQIIESQNIEEGSN